ncbi:sensor histidine kinase [Georgenia sp. Z1344]|uniref:sensor histidine kinase n=1 Tax=Georgenia sp. Z1344 TaxID=3416706 RepID=UPI003CE8A1CE
MAVEEVTAPGERPGSPGATSAHPRPDGDGASRSGARTGAAGRGTAGTGTADDDALGAEGWADRGTDPLLTGALGRLLARYPGALDLVLATAYVVVMLGLAIVGALSRYTPVAVVGIAETLALGAVILLRRRAPLVLLGVALTVPVLARIADSGLEPDPPVVTIWSYDPTTPLPVFDILVTPRISPVEIVAVAVLVLTIALERPGRTTVVASVSAVVVAVCAYLVFGGEGTRMLDGAEAAGVIAVAALVGSNLRERRRRVAQLGDRARRLALERDQREQLAVSSERTRIAREMHDVLAHSLSVMVTLADGAVRIMDRDPARARSALERLAGTGREALGDTRRMVGMLRDDTRAAPVVGAGSRLPGVSAPLAPQPVVGELDSLVESFRGAGLPVSLEVTGLPLPDDTTLSLTVYRIVQECLTNVLRYAPGSPAITVTIARTAGQVTITVENVAGGEPTVPGGSGRGLIGIRERVAVFDGSVTAGPTDTGWRVEARLRVGAGTMEART